MAVVLPFRRRRGALTATAMVTEAPTLQPSGRTVPARLLDEANVDAAATWLNRAYAVLEKAPDWTQLPLEGRIIRLRGLLDAEAYRIGVDRMTDRGWMEFVRAYTGTDSKERS
jgi:hypothetical protein